MSTSVRQSMIDWGLVPARANGELFPFGIQFDATASENNGIIRSMCNLHCDDELGGYKCVSRAYAPENRGFPKKYASAPQVVATAKVASVGLRAARDKMLVQNGVFDQYLKQSQIPNDVALVLRETMEGNGLEWNDFGTPEIVPDHLEAISGLKRLGMNVNLTTHGGIFLTKPEYLSKFLQDPPGILAVSADDWEPGTLEKHLDMTTAELLAAFKSQHSHHGQAKKFMASVNAAQLSSEHSNFPRLLYNQVLYEGNMDRVVEMLEVVSARHPKVLINMYPAQAAHMDFARSSFTPNGLGQLKDLSIWHIQETQKGNPHITHRLAYHLAILSVLEAFEHEPRRAADIIGGAGFWLCYGEVGAGLYLQISGVASELINIEGATVGGRGRCYWRSDAIDHRRLFDSPELVDEYVSRGIVKTGWSAKKRCGGCAFPRLNFWVFCLERGMSRAKQLVWQIAWPYYLKNRMKYCQY